MKRLILSVAVMILVGASAFADEVAPPVTVTESGSAVELSNGTVQVTVSKPKAAITSIRYRHDGSAWIEMANTMYYSYSASTTDAKGVAVPGGGKVRGPRAEPVRIVQQGPDAAEVVLENGPFDSYPFHTETHYVLPRGKSGFYVYQIYSRDTAQPPAFLGEARFVIKGQPGPSLYTNHVVDADRMAPLDWSPSVKTLSDATFLLQDGTIYCKYNNSVLMKDHHVHGMTGHGVGIWMVNASEEYKNGGPNDQDLTVHQGNTLLNMLEGAHYGAGVQNFAAGEPWRKFYGPFFVYVNHGASTVDLYNDAVRCADAEQKLWPYAWASSADYPIDRGTVSGTLRLTNGAPAAGATVVLAAPGGEWPLQGKSYEFWGTVAADGSFRIPKVRPGAYTLYAYGANQFEQFVKDGVNVAVGPNDLGSLGWKPATHGATLWQIGVPDRGTAEFKEGGDVRHFANFLRYGTDFPNDVTYTVGKSQPETDWNFAQWTWYSKRPYWAIDFSLPKASRGTATLTFGIAASNPAGGGSNNVEIQINGQKVGQLHLTKSGAAVYRSGGQDSLYRVVYVTFDAKLLRAGKNELTLRHLDARPIPPVAQQLTTPIGAVLYDAIRLETSGN